MALRFVWKSIWPWSRVRRDRTSGRLQRRENGGGTEGEGDLGAVLAAYDRRFDTAAEEARLQTQKQAEFHREARRLLETVLIPTLDELGAEIRAHGHTWSIESRVDIGGQPALACTFSPREADQTAGSGSELSFRFRFPDRLTVTGTDGEGSEFDDMPARSHRTRNLDGTLVRQEVTRFLACLIGEGEEPTS